VLALAGTLVTAVPVAADSLPAANQALLLLRVLAYDRKLTARAGAQALVVVAFQPGRASSEAMRSQMVGELRTIAGNSKVLGLPIAVAAVPVADLDRALARTPAAAVYVCPGVDDVTGLAAVTRRRSALSFTSIEADVRQTLGVGLLLRGSKAAILVNLPATRAEGAALDASLLRLAEVIR
jgi:hypothetical protein